MVDVGFPVLLVRLKSAFLIELGRPFDHNGRRFGHRTRKNKTMFRNNVAYLFLVAFFLFIIIDNCMAIDCFKCQSYGGANPWCEDPFHHNFSASILHTSCMAGRKGRDGMYPATACIKLSGRFEDNDETMIIRDCALDSGSLTADTELVRMSHCGGFYFDGRYVRGCVQSCAEDACNGSIRYQATLLQVFLLFTIHIILN